LYIAFMVNYMFKIQGIPIIFEGERVVLVVEGFSLDCSYLPVMSIQGMLEILGDLRSILVDCCFSECLDYKEKVRQRDEERAKKELESLFQEGVLYNRTCECYLRGQKVDVNYCAICSRELFCRFMDESEIVSYDNDYMVTMVKHMIVTKGPSLDDCKMYANIMYHSVTRNEANTRLCNEDHIVRDLVDDVISNGSTPSYICFDVQTLLFMDLTRKWDVSPAIAYRLVQELGVYKDELPLSFLESCCYLCCSVRHVKLLLDCQKVRDYLFKLIDYGELEFLVDEDRLGSMRYIYKPSNVVKSLGPSSVELLDFPGLSEKVKLYQVQKQMLGCCFLSDGVDCYSKRFFNCKILELPDLIGNYEYGD